MTYFDRKAAAQVIGSIYARGSEDPDACGLTFDDMEEWVDELEQCVRPGLRLSPEEARIAHGACRVALQAEDFWAAAHEHYLQALAARLQQEIRPWI